MDIGSWLSSRDWAATGGMLTAIFTGFTAWMIWWNRARTKVVIDPTEYAMGSELTMRLQFSVRNLGSKPAIGVRVMRVRPNVGKKPVTERIASIAPGESVDLEISYGIPIDGPYVLNEETGKYPDTDPERVDFGEDFIEVTFLHPPRLKRETTLRALVHTMREDLRAISG